MNKLISEILIIEKFQTEIAIKYSEFKRIMKRISMEEFSDNNPFTMHKKATYDINISKKKIAISRNVRYMNFMRPEGVMKIREDNANTRLDLVIRPFIAGRLFLFGCIIGPIILFTQATYDFKSLKSILTGLVLSIGFFLFGYIAAWIAFKMESTKMKQDIITFLLKNKAFEKLDTSLPSA